MKCDSVNFHLLPLVDGDSKLGSVRKKGVGLLVHGDGHVQETFVHVVIANSLGGDCLDVLVEDPAGQQVNLALDGFLF